MAMLHKVLEFEGTESRPTCSNAGNRFTSFTEDMDIMNNTDASYQPTLAKLL